MKLQQPEKGLAWLLGVLLAWFLFGSAMSWLSERGHPAAERAAKSRAFYQRFIVGERR